MQYPDTQQYTEDWWSGKMPICVPHWKKLLWKLPQTTVSSWPSPVLVWDRYKHVKLIRHRPIKLVPNYNHSVNRLPNVSRPDCLPPDSQQTSSRCGRLHAQVDSQHVDMPHGLCFGAKPMRLFSGRTWFSGHALHFATLQKVIRPVVRGRWPCPMYLIACLKNTQSYRVPGSRYHSFCPSEHDGFHTGFRQWECLQRTCFTSEHLQLLHTLFHYHSCPCRNKKKKKKKKTIWIDHVSTICVRWWHFQNITSHAHWCRHC